MVLRKRSNSFHGWSPGASAAWSGDETASVSIVAGGGKGDFMTVRRLRARGSNREIGRAMATAARAVHEADAGPHRAVDPDVQCARRRWFAIHHPVLLERMAGAAEVFGVDRDSDDWDLGRLGRVEVPAGCSAVFHPGAGTKNRHALLGRNFDFPTGTYSDIVGLPRKRGESPLAADVWVIELRPDDGYATVVVGIMDMMGGMDGINQVGLVVTLLADNESPAPEPAVVPQVGLSEQQVVRYLLETCRDVEEAKQALLMAKQYYIFVPCHFLVADRSGRSFVWEYSRGHNREHIVEPEAPGPLVCTNHLLHRWPDPARLPEDPRSAGTAAFTYDRWRALETQSAATAMVDADDVRAHLDTVRFTLPSPGVRTLWQAIYDLDQASLELSFFTGDRRGVTTTQTTSASHCPTTRRHSMSQSDRPPPQRASSGSPLEPEIGFSRAVRKGNHVALAGTAPIGADGNTVGEGDVAAQTRRCLEISAEALAAVGATLADVVRTRIMLTDITRWREAAAVHGEYFSGIQPAATFVEVSRFIDPHWLVETEVDAITDDDRARET